MFGARQDDFEQVREIMDPGLVELVEVGRGLKASDVARARIDQSVYAATWAEWTLGYDLLLTPALAVPAFDVETLAPPGWESDAYWLKWSPFSYPFNMTQQPACSVPCGFTTDRLPVGLQIVADCYREDLVLRAAAAFEATQPAVRWPGQG